MVWVNLDSGVCRWYGKTQNGKYLPEADSIKGAIKQIKTMNKRDR